MTSDRTILAHVASAIDSLEEIEKYVQAERKCEFDPVFEKDGTCEGCHFFWADRYEEVYSCHLNDLVYALRRFEDDLEDNDVE